MANRNEMLKNFINNEKIYELTGLPNDSLDGINFKPDADGDLIVESLKKLIFSFRANEAHATVIRNVNVEIEKNDWITLINGDKNAKQILLGMTKNRTTSSKIVSNMLHKSSHAIWYNDIIKQNHMLS